MDYTSALEQFDFSKNEATVYLALLELGLTNVGPIVQKTGMHRQLIYQALGNLENKGYVTSVTRNQRKNFQAIAPDVLLQHIEEQADRARLLIPELEKLQSHAEDSVEVRTMFGLKGYISNLKDIVNSAIRTDKCMRIIGGAPDEYFYSLIGDWYKDYIALLQKNNVTKKLIAPEIYSDLFKKKFAREKGNELRTMEVGLSSPTYTRMTPEMVSIEIHTQGRDVTVIQIRNRTIAKHYIEHFNLIWEHAKIFSATGEQE